MPTPTAVSRHPLMPMLALFLAGLVSCGGGSDSAPAVVTAVAPAAADDGAALEALRLKPITEAAAGATDTAVTTDMFAAAANAAAVGSTRALTASASLAIAGVADAPTPAAALPVDSTGRTFYIDSSNGSDLNNGRAATAGGQGAGPWRSLARLMSSGLAPGDSVVLACGSRWHETLSLSASGTAAHPITVGAPRSGCTDRPTIDGGVSIAPAAWTQHSGNIYKAALDTAPMQLFAGSGVFTEAHHPNRGHLASDPASPYAALAADGDVVTANGHKGSTRIVVGADLGLPPGAVIAPGTRVRVRTGSWLIDELQVRAVSGNSLALAGATSYPVHAGWGYLLLGALWMLDSAGEWYYDPVERQLYAWMPDSNKPGAVTAAVLDKGIDLTGRAYVTIDGVQIRRVQTGVAMPGTAGLSVRNSQFSDIAEMGIDAAYSNGATFDSNGFAQVGHDAISGQTDISAPSTGMIVRNNVIRDSGVTMSGENVISLPKRSHAAIRSGSNSLVTGNTIVNAGYIGIRPGANSVVADNFVFGACSVLDDCGAIYTWSDPKIAIRRNTIVRVRGALAGKPASERFTQGQGIYLDQWTTDTAIEDNTVVDADNGIMVHVSSNTSIRGNTLFGNRTSQLWMQDTSNKVQPGGDVYGNSVTDNLIVPISSDAVGLLLESSFASTAAFGSFDRNQYLDRASPVAARVSAANGTSSHTLAQWQLSRDAGSTQPVEANGSGVAGKGYTTYAIAGANLVPNGAAQQSAAGWSTWNQTAPMAQLLRQTCAAGQCLRFVAGGSSGLVSSPNFSVQKGQWYRLTVDLAADQDGQSLLIVARRGGGGNNGYEWISDRDLSVTASKTWTRYSTIFQATATVIAGNPATGDYGARIDIQDLVPGKSASLANMELVAIQPSAAAQMSSVLMNVGTSTTNVACPLAGSQTAQCASLRSLANDQLIAWPLIMPPRTATLVYTQDAALIDSDGDGIPDSQDQCPGTAAGVAVNAGGCSFQQR